VPTRRTTKQKTHLSDNEKAICLRVKEARQCLRLDQSEVARRLGLEPHAISTIEKCRVPLRFDIALRFCRELIVNEEWLATGCYLTLEKEAKRLGVTKTGDAKDLHPLFFRLTCDLWSEDVTRKIPARALYSEAFAQFLSPVYEQLAIANFYHPRLKPNMHDTLDIFKAIVDANIDGGLILLANEARRGGVDGLLHQRQYLRKLFEASVRGVREILDAPLNPPTPRAAPASSGKGTDSRLVKK